MIYAYGNSGGIEDVKKRIIIPPYFNHYKTLHDLIDVLQKRSFYDNDVKAYKNLKVIHHGYDSRLNKVVFMVVADYSGHHEQFVCFFIEEETT